MGTALLRNPCLFVYSILLIEFTRPRVCVCVCVYAAHDAFCLGDVGLRRHANDLVRIKKADGTPKFVTTADLFGLAKEDLEV